MNELENKINCFTQQMLKELNNNSYKGSFLDFNDINSIIIELEYHKAKMILAIRLNQKQAPKEYIADTANFLFALGNAIGLYENDFNYISNGSFEIKSRNSIKKPKKVLK